MKKKNDQIHAAEVEPHLNEVQLAARFAVSVKLIQAMRVKGNGVKYIKVGRLVRYRMDSVLEFENAHSHDNTTK